MGKADAIVVGSGIIGTAISLGLRQRGFSVLCVDAGPTPGSGSTSYSSGICRMQYSVLNSVRLAWESYQYYDNWADFVRLPASEPVVSLRQSGSLIPVCPSSKPFLERTVPCLKEIGLDVEEWSVEELVQRSGYDVRRFRPVRRIDDPLFGESDGSTLDGAVYVPTTGFISDPQLAASNLAKAGMAIGVEFRHRQQVIAVTEDASGAVSGVRLSDGSSIEAPIVVNCCGPYSRDFNNLAFSQRELPNDSRIANNPVRVEVAHIKRPATGADFLVTDFDVGVYWRPDVDGKAIVGSVEPECDPHDIISDMSQFNSNLTEQWTNQVYRAALRMPHLEIPSSTDTQGIVSMYDITDDWVPIYDKTNFPGYYLAIGTSGNQFKNAPVVGMMMAELIEKCQNGHDHDKEPIQYNLQRTAGKIDMGAFSRLRQVHETSGTVLG